jgi:hypothetical protein
MGPSQSLTPRITPGLSSIAAVAASGKDGKEKCRQAIGGIYPFIVWLASSASRGLIKVMKPNPRYLPVSRSVGM